MSFFKARRPSKGSNSRPGPNPNKLSTVSSNGRVANNPFQDAQTKPLPNIPHAKSVDLPHSRKLIVLQEYKPVDNRGLNVKRGESVQVINQEGGWLFVRNEWGKEGFVPSSHLVAPYTSTRSRKGTLSNPIRPVASGSSINDMEPPGHAVPMYPSHSAGRPRNLSAGDENRVNGSVHGIQRVLSPQVLSQNDMNGSSLSQGMTSNYEQKYSPSSSSGVASMNGPSSPSFQSHSNTSQENVRNDSSASSLTHEQCSLSSNEERPHSLGFNGSLTNGHGGLSEEEQSNVRNGRVTSESNINHIKVHVTTNDNQQQPNKDGVYVSTPTYHVYSTITSETPPPVPPRVAQQSNYSASQGDQCYDDRNSDSSSDRFGHQSRVKSLNDIRMREVRHHHQHQQQQQQQPMYAEVYKQQKHSGMNGAEETNGHYHRLDFDRTPSEGGSSRRSSSKHSSRSSNRTPQDGAAYDSQDIVPLPSRVVDSYSNMGPNSQFKIGKFRKCLWGVFVVTHDFTAYDENEVSVQKGDHVSVWNQDDNEWFWIVKHTSAEEGFVPSSYLHEIVSSDPQHMPVADVSSQHNKPPPIPPKHHQHQQQPQPQHYQTTQHYRDDSSRFRHRAYSGGESRPPPGPAAIIRRPSAGGSDRLSSDRSRGRLSSDGSNRSSLKAQASSTASVEKTGIPPDSPPNSPPPPYSEYDQQSHPPAPPRSQQTRHFSLSQQTELSPTAAPGAYSTHMQRTHSQGYVPHRQGRRGQPHPLPVVANGSVEYGRRHDERLTSPPELYTVRSPTAMPGGGTLV